jgi:hypothetical protein
MAWRRVILFCVLLVVIGVVASATVPRDKGAPVRRTLPAQAAPVPPADAAIGRLPGPADRPLRVVRAQVGDVVQIDVTHDAEDVVEVPALGVAEPVEPGIDAQLVFDADQPGRFAVTLRDAGRRIGTIDVKQPG